MFMYVIVLVFLTGLQIGSSNPQKEKNVAGPQTVTIKKNEVSANGVENYSEILKNFRNPVLEYLLDKYKDESIGGLKKGMVREIRHSQTLVLLPNFWKEFRPSTGTFVPRSDSLNTVLKASRGHLIHNSDHSPLDDFLSRIRNKTSENAEKSGDYTIKSQVLRVNPNFNESNNNDLTKIQICPAIGVSMNIFGKNGVLKSTLTHFQPDFRLANIVQNQKEAFFLDGPSNAEKNFKIDHNNQFNYFSEDNPIQSQNLMGEHENSGEKHILKPTGFTVLSNPLMNLQNLLSTSVYNAVSSLVEYDLKENEIGKKAFRENEFSGNVLSKKQTVNKLSKQPTLVVEPLALKQQEFLSDGLNVGLPSKNFENQEIETKEPNFFDEVTIRSSIFSGIKKRPISIERIRENEKQEFGMAHLRSKRDTTSVLLKTRHGDHIDLSLEGPVRNEQNQRKSTGGDLIIRKGGIAIAGPGGAATAYTGGTAIVGPYGTVYKSPQGVAIVGPYSKIINITDDTSFEDILKMHKEAKGQSPKPKAQNRSLYQNQNQRTRFKNYRNFFSYITDLPIKIEMPSHKKNFNRNHTRIAKLKESDVSRVIEKMRNEGFKKLLQETQFEEKMVKDNETTLIFRPKSKAEAGKSGVAVSTPISHAILLPGQTPKIYFEPESVASAGPLGLAHAHSDLFVSYLSNDAVAIKSHAHDHDFKTMLRRRLNRRQ